MVFELSSAEALFFGCIGHLGRMFDYSVKFSAEISHSVHPSLPRVTVLVLTTILLAVLISQLIACISRKKRNLDRLENDDELLARGDLRALRRALLIADIKGHPSRILNHVKDASQRDLIRHTGVRGDGLTSIFSEPGTVNVSDREKILKDRLQSEIKDGDETTTIPSLLRGNRVFKHMEMDVIADMAGMAEQVLLTKGSTLFKPGIRVRTPSLFVIKSGEIEMTLPDGRRLRCFGPGDNVTGLLDLLAGLTGVSVDCEVLAKATKNTTLFKWSSQGSFNKLKQKYPSAINRIIRLILVRLNSAVFMTSYRYLGLTSQLRKPMSLNTYIQEQVNSGMYSPIAMQNSVRNVVGKCLGIPAYDVPEVALPAERSFARMDLFSPKAVERARRRQQGSHSGAKPPAEYDDGGDRLYDCGNRIKVIETKKNTVLARPGDPPCLFFVMSGTIRTSLHGRDLYQIKPGGMLGLIYIQTGEFWSVGVESFGQTIVLQMSRSLYITIVKKFPEVAITAGATLCKSLSPLARIIDHALSWTELFSGDLLVREGDSCDKMYVVLEGRLRASKQKEKDVADQSWIEKQSVAIARGHDLLESKSGGSAEKNKSPRSRRFSSGWSIDGPELTVGERGRNEAVGQMEILAGGTHKATVRAIRDTQLSGLTKELFEYIVEKHPITLGFVLRKISEDRSQPSSVSQRTGMHRISTVAVFPITPNADLDYFVPALTKTLSNIGPAASINSKTILKAVGQRVFEGSKILANSAVISYLAQLEETNKVVVYQCDPFASDWTRRCVRQADVILLVGDAIDPPDVGQFEFEEIEGNKINSQIVLVLLHDMKKMSQQSSFGSPIRTATSPLSSGKERFPVSSSNQKVYRPTNTRDWITNRETINHHFHVRVHPSDPEFDSTVTSDVARVSRWLTGRQIGLVLGGGGARGMAHLGVLKALEEENIPIDVIGGTSQGAFVGAMAAMTHDPYTSVPARRSRRDQARKFALEMSSTWNLIKDLTYPLTAYFSGSGMNSLLMDNFQTMNIEDLWLDYYCISTDLTDSCECVHRNGVLWRYVRASMSLGPFVPPICDTSEGGKKVHYLVDGGYVNIVPVDVMAKVWHPETIIAVDVANYEQFGEHDYGDSFSGFRECILRCFKRGRKVPSMTDISSQLAFVTCMRDLPQKISDHCDLFLHPPVGGYGTLDYDKHGDIREIGYKHAKVAIQKWRAHMHATGDTRFDHVKESQKRKRTRSLPTIGTSLPQNFVYTSPPMSNHRKSVSPTSFTP